MIRVCVIGAGCSGLATIKSLLDEGIKDIVCYEQNAWIGGNWKYTAEVSHSSVCSTTHIISSKKLSEFSDFPMPEDYPDYPSHEQVLQYFESYADRFNLRDYICFNTKVDTVKKTASDQWEVMLEDGSSELFTHLLVANGHHSAARHPDWASDFSGRYMHSHSFKNNKEFEDEKVLVVGAGNSACDCAVEISRVARRVDLSIRTPQYIIPKFFLGQPSDTFNKGTLWIPRSIRNFILRVSLLY